MASEAGDKKLLNNFSKLIELVSVLVLSCCWMATVHAQSPSPSQSPCPSPTDAAVSPSKNAATSGDDTYLREGLKSMADDSRTLTGWCLAMIAASVLAIASTSYFRPAGRWTRSIYLLFIPGWILIGLSIFNGNAISRRYTAVAFTRKREVLLEIGNSMNHEFSNQLTFLHVGLAVFSAWLLLYIVWWVFGNTPASE